MTGVVAAVLARRGVGLPIGAIAVLSAVAGWVDARTHRIPHELSSTALLALVLGAIVVLLVDSRGVLDVVGGAVGGVVLSGAVFLAVLWAVRPASIGGGDVKLLTVQGAAIGLLAPLAAPLILVGASLVGVGQALVLRRGRDLPMAAGLALGFGVAVIAGIAGDGLLGGPYG
jgi:prepilin signal peptidase PulO-like enzyme (type II secretory pathway)